MREDGSHTGVREVESHAGVEGPGVREEGSHAGVKGPGVRDKGSQRGVAREFIGVGAANRLREVGGSSAPKRSKYCGGGWKSFSMGMAY